MSHPEFMKPAAGSRGGWDLGQLERIFGVEHPNPHEVLGPHIFERNFEWSTAIRAFLPECDGLTVAIRARGARWYERLSATRIHDAGFFELIVPGRMDVEYHFEFRETDGAVSRFDDPYRFPPTVSAPELARLVAGDDDASLLGPRPVTLEGVEGIGFIFRIRDAVQASVVGDFNLWDGRRHMMRCLSAGLWEVFAPGVGSAERYKVEVKTSDGDVLLRADPSALCAGGGEEVYSLTPSTNGCSASTVDAQWIHPAGH